MISTFLKKTASKTLGAVNLAGTVFARGRFEFVIFLNNKGR